MSDPQHQAPVQFSGILPKVFREVQGPAARAAVVALETLGPHARVVELAVVLLEVEKSERRFTKTLETHHGFQDPHEPLSPDFTAATGIAAEMLAGKSLDLAALRAALLQADWIIAYNAGRVRPPLQALIPELDAKVFACARNQIEWPAKGFACRDLRHLAFDHGWFFTGSRADIQAAALAKLLDEPDRHAGRAYLEELLSRADEPLINVEADADPRDRHMLREEHFVWSRNKGVWERSMGPSTLRRVLANLKSRGFDGRIMEREQLPASERFKGSRHGKG